MRLVCPNCSAQYEIDGSMIPDEGRDVQCSNCGHTWFELPPHSAGFGELSAEDFDDMHNTASEIEVSDEADQVTDKAIEDEEPEAKPDDSEDQNAVPDEDDIKLEDDQVEDESENESPGSASETFATAAASALEDDEEEDFPDFGATPKPRRPADAATLNILREEAEREMSQRRAPISDSIETQTDLGIEEIQNRQSPSRALRARMAHLGEEQPETKQLDEVKSDSPVSDNSDYPDTSGDDAEYTEPSRDLLPDIDEINSTLKPTGRRDSNSRPKRGNGFLFGFLFMLLLTAAMIFAYVKAPAIVRAVPSAEGSVITYVDRANAVRDWVQGLIEK